MVVNLLNNITSHDMLLFIVVISLVLISITMVYLVYSQNKQLTKELIKKDNNSNNETLDLKELSKKLENIHKPNNIYMTQFEKDQEEKAIISYDELLKNKDNVSIGYASTELKDNIEVKKIDLDNTGELELDPIKKELNTKITLVTYEHEEEFLNSLKQLQYLLNK